MTDLFVSGFLHSGLISEENVIEDYLSLLKLFYILMDIVPAFRSYVINECEKSRNSIFGASLETFQIETRLDEY